MIRIEERTAPIRRPGVSWLCRLSWVRQVSSTSEVLWELGYQLLKFGLRPSAGGAGTHASLRAEGECEFGDVVPVRGIDNNKEIVVAGSEIDLLDFNSHFLGELPSRLSPLGSVLDRTDSLLGPVERQYERWHAALHPLHAQGREAISWAYTAPIDYFEADFAAAPLTRFITSSPHDLANGRSDVLMVRSPTFCTNLMTISS